MDIDLDDSIEAELVRRKAVSVQVEKTVANKDTESIEQIEERARKAEREFEQAKLPES